MMDAMDEDLHNIEPEWKSALAIVALVLACIFLIAGPFWL